MRHNEFLRPKDVAHMLGISYVTVTNLMKKGQINGFKVGGQWRIHPDEFKRFLQDSNIPEDALSPLPEEEEKEADSSETNSSTT